MTACLVDVRFSPKSRHQSVVMIAPSASVVIWRELREARYPHLLGVAGLDIRARNIWKFPVECLPILDTAAQKLRPGRDCDILCTRFGKQTPKLWMMPAQIVPTTVAVGTDAGPQPNHLGNQFFSGPVLDVLIHRP